MRTRLAAALSCALLLIAATAAAEEIGEVSTTFKLVGANDKIVIEAFDDPDIGGATCYVSRARTGGIKGSIGVAEDTSDASISCR
ncbi:MAG: CreA family protein, partial [Proteobacteria bacterium]|nr:CreA family protein [Pseudomonadota bacterium]